MSYYNSAHRPFWKFQRKIISRLKFKIINLLQQQKKDKMKKLKETLGKQQQKKKKNQNTSSTVFGVKKSEWNDLNTIILCRSPNKTTVHEPGFDAFFINLIQSSVKKNGIVRIENIVKQIIQNLHQNPKHKLEEASENKSVKTQELKKLEEIKQLVESVIRKNQTSDQVTNDKNQIIYKFYQQLIHLIRNKDKISKKQKLQEYDRLIKLLSPRKIYKNQKKRQMPNMSSKNFKVKFTKQQYQIKRQSSQDSSIRVGSEGKKVKTSGSSHSLFKSQNGHEKLKKLMQKQPSLKIIKTKVKYDFSAILEASKSKIQPRSRNITTANSNKMYGNDLTTKLNKAKKNEAFVFYRPSAPYKKDSK